MAATTLDRPGRAEHGHRRRARARQPAAGAAAARRHVHRPRARPGAAAGRALRRPDDVGQRRLPCRSSRYFDRITRPEQLLVDAAAGGPGAHRPGRRRAGRARAAAGRAGRGVRLPAWRCSSRGCTGCRGRAPTATTLADAVETLRSARAAAAGRRRRRALLGGRPPRRSPSPRRTACPVVETVAGRTARAARPPAATAARSASSASTSANDLAAEADVVLAVGTRLQDFTTSSWTAFAAGVRIVTVNAARFDAVKHSAPGRGRRRAREPSSSWPTALGGLGGRRGAGPREAPREQADWDAHVDRLREGVAPDGSLTYAQVVGVVNDASGPDDYVLDRVRRDAGRAARRLAHRRSSSTTGPRPRAPRWTSSTASPAWATRSSRPGAPRWRVRRPTPTGWSPRCRRRVLPDAQLRALLRRVRRAPLRRRCSATTRASP